jgi:Glycosyl transferases group 1
VRKTVLIYFPYFHDDAKSTSMGIYCLDLAAELGRLGLEPVLLSIQSGGFPGKSISLPRFLRTSNWRLNSLLFAPFGLLLAALKYGLKNSVLINVSHEFVLPWPGKRAVTVVHDLIQLQTPSNWARALLVRFNLAIARLTHLVSISGVTANELTKIGMKSEVIYTNTFNVSEARPFNAAEFRQRPLLAVWCGTGHPHKRPELFVELARQFPDDQFTMVVPPADRAALSMNATPNLMIKSNLSGADLNRLLRETKILVSTSTQEGFGRPPLEMLIAGGQIVISDIQIYREIYGSVGRFFDGTLQSLIDAVLDAKKHPTQYDIMESPIRKKINQMPVLASMIAGL